MRLLGYCEPYRDKGCKGLRVQAPRDTKSEEAFGLRVSGVWGFRVWGLGMGCFGFRAADHKLP